MLSSAAVAFVVSRIIFSCSISFAYITVNVRAYDRAEGARTDEREQTHTRAYASKHHIHADTQPTPLIHACIIPDTCTLSPTNLIAYFTY